MKKQKNGKYVFIGVVIGCILLGIFAVVKYTSVFDNFVPELRKYHLQDSHIIVSSVYYDDDFKKNNLKNIIMRDLKQYKIKSVVFENVSSSPAYDYKLNISAKNNKHFNNKFTFEDDDVPFDNQVVANIKLLLDGNSIDDF